LKVAGGGVAYAAIAFEHPTKINKGASALLGAGSLWTVYAVFGGDHALIGNQLNESVTTHSPDRILPDRSHDDCRGDRRS